MFAFFPFQDVNRARRFPYVSWLIIGACAVVHGHVMLMSRDAQDTFLTIHGFVPVLFSRALPGATQEKPILFDSREKEPVVWVAPGQRPIILLPASYRPFVLLSPITYMFLHGGLLHVILNMWAFWIYSDNVEDRMGHLRFLGFYFFCGLVAIAAHFALHTGDVKPVVGASGALAGVMAAYLRLFPHASIRCFIWFIFIVRIVEVPALVVIVAWFASQLLSVLGGSAENVAWYAHIGGFLAGLWLSARWFPHYRFRFAGR